VGVPRSLAHSTIPFHYNDIDAVRKIVDENPDLGVLKMEVSRNHGPLPGYLEEIRKITSEHGIIFILDECTSGFRETFGGLHKKYNIEPDLAIFGKTLGNGYAITGVIGRREIMQAAQQTFISSTFWTERIGPSAALAALRVMEREQSWITISEIGMDIRKRWKQLGEQFQFKIEISGLAALSSFHIVSEHWLAYKTFITQEMLKRGILAANSIYVCVAHTAPVIDRYFAELEQIFKRIQDFEGGEDVYACLDGPVCHTGFKRLN